MRPWCRKPATLAFASLLILTMCVDAYGKKKRKPNRALELVDKVEVLVPEQETTENDADRIRSAALYSMARIHYKRREFEEALKLYQRAWRSAPQQTNILQEITSLAFELKRSDVAARYAVLLAEREPKDPGLLRQLGLHLSQSEQWDRAIRLLKTARSLDTNQSENEAKAKLSSLTLNLELGRLYFLAGDFANSAEEFEPAFKAILHPEKFDLTAKDRDVLVGKPERTFTVMAESFLQATKYERAKQAFQELHKVEDDDSDLQFNLARVDQLSGNHSEAINKCEGLFANKDFKLTTEVAELYCNALESKHADNDTQQEVLERLTHWRKKLNHNRVLGVVTANRLIEWGKLEQARKLLRDTLASGQTSDAYDSLLRLHHKRKDAESALLVIGQVAGQTGSLDPVEKALTELIEDANFTSRVIAQGKKRLQSGVNMAAESGNLIGAGYVALSAESFDDASEIFDSVLKSETPLRQSILLNWSLSLLRAERYQDAADKFAETIAQTEKDSEKAAMYFYASGALAMAGDTKAALDSAEKALALEPKSIQFQERPAWILYQADRHVEAEERYTQLLSRYSTNYKSRQARELVRDVQLILSNICVMTDRMPDAEEWLEKVLDEFPEDIGAMNDLGYLWADQNKRSWAALKMTLTAVQSEPKNKAYRDSLGWALYRLGRYDEAIKQLEIAADAEDTDGVILDHLGDAYRKVDRLEDAVRCWQQALEDFQTSDEPKLAAKTQQKLAKSKQN